jgi:hypothetical protein
MSVYYGTVKNNTVILPKDISLTEGITVEVRIPSPTPSSKKTTEAAFQQRLLELGLMTEIKKPRPSLPLTEPVLVRVKGKALSEMIIEERR